MTMKVTLNLDETLYERAKLLAQSQRQDIAKALTKWLEETLPAAEEGGIPKTSIQGDDAAIDREMQAYIAMHPRLLQRYRNQYVAIHNGELVDHDKEFDSLLARIDAAYPNQFVWLTKVEEQPIRELTFRSPRLTRID